MEPTLGGRGFANASTAVDLESTRGDTVMAARKILLETPVPSPTRPSPVEPRKFPRSPALDAEAKSQVYRQWRRGVSHDALAEQLGRSVAVVERAVNEGRRKLQRGDGI